MDIAKCQIAVLYGSCSYTFLCTNNKKEETQTNICCTTDDLRYLTFKHNIYQWDFKGFPTFLQKRKALKTVCFLTLSISLIHGQLGSDFSFLLWIQEHGLTSNRNRKKLKGLTKRWWGRLMLRLLTNDSLCIIAQENSFTERCSWLTAMPCSIKSSGPNLPFCIL